MTALFLANNEKKKNQTRAVSRSGVQEKLSALLDGSAGGSAQSHKILPIITAALVKSFWTTLHRVALKHVVTQRRLTRRVAASVEQLKTCDIR